MNADSSYFIIRGNSVCFCLPTLDLYQSSDSCMFFRAMVSYWALMSLRAPVRSGLAVLSTSIFSCWVWTLTWTSVISCWWDGQSQTQGETISLTPVLPPSPQCCKSRKPLHTWYFTYDLINMFHNSTWSCRQLIMRENVQILPFKFHQKYFIHYSINLCW